MGINRTCSSSYLEGEYNHEHAQNLSYPSLDHQCRLFASGSQPTVLEEIQPDLEEYFQEFDGAFVLCDLQANRYTRYTRSDVPKGFCLPPRSRS